MNNIKQGLRTSDCKRQIIEKDMLMRRAANDRKKLNNEIVDRKQQLYDPEIIPNSRERDNSMPRPVKAELITMKKLKNIDNEVFNVQDIQTRNAKSVVKLPNINSKTTICKTAVDKDTVIMSTPDSSVGNQNVARISNGKNDSIEKKVSPSPKQDKVDDSGLGFMKLINVRTIKPSGRSPDKNMDRSMRQIRLTRLQQNIKNQRKRAKDASSIRKMIKQEQSDKQKQTDKKKQPQSEKVATLNETGEQMAAIRQKKTFSITHKVSSQSTSANSTTGGNTVTMVDRRKKVRTTYLDFCLFISLMNKMNKPEQAIVTYKAYVGKGNNSVMVKNVLKNRFWWTILSQPDPQCNLTWTQGRDNKLIQSMKKMNQADKKLKNKGKVHFVLKPPLKEQGKVNPFKDHTKVGLTKLMSSNQKETLSKNDFHMEIPSQQYYQIENPNKVRMHNHLQFNWNLCSKKALFYNLKAYYTAIKQDPFQYIPLTYHIHSSEGDEGDQFEAAFNENEQNRSKKKGDGKGKKAKNLWIIKPGQNSNQGFGIQVSDSLEEMKQMIKSNQNKQTTRHRSFIIQKYIMPFLYLKRKFDIRCYMVVTSVNSIVKAYWHEEGYIRTSSKDFSVKDVKNKMIHLTNDAIQKKSEQYGKFQNGNKISFADFQRYLDNSCPDKGWNFYDKVYPQMMKLAADCVRSTLLKLDSNKRQFCFQLFGLDFMIDQEFQTWLIQVNNNPCLSLSSPLLARIIPNMVQNAVRIAVDPYFPPPADPPKSKTVPTELFQSNKFTLIFNSNEEGQQLQKILTIVDFLEEECEEDEQEEQNAEDIQ